ncbi:unnamed protein product, partial [Ectocarpus sp. 12 AP-2014]
WTTSAQDSLPPQHKQARSPLSSGVPETDPTRRGGGEDAGLGRAPGSYHSRRGVDKGVRRARGEGTDSSALKISREKE